MTSSGRSVFIVDDDASFRKGVVRLLRSNGVASESFGSAEDFLGCGLADRAGCIVLDVHMPGLSGLDLQQELARLDCTMPVVFLTGRGDIPMSVQAMKAGAADFLTKPVDEEALLAAIRRALASNERRRKEREQVEEIRSRVRALTEREHEVMRHVISGDLNKQIAGDLAIAEKTVKVHRARVMEKMGVDSVAELVRRCAAAGIDPARTTKVP